MPHKPERYNPDWPAVSKRIRERAGDCCERCGAPDQTWVQRNTDHEWMRLDVLDGWNSGAALDWIGDPELLPVWIVLTVAHVNQDTRDDRDENLLALCQRCHLNLDRPHNIVKSRETRRRKRAEAVAAAGQMGIPL